MSDALFSSTVGDPFLLSLFFVFAAEMGDKTQLVALAFATRYVTGAVTIIEAVSHQAA